LHNSGAPRREIAHAYRLKRDEIRSICSGNGSALPLPLGEGCRSILISDAVAAETSTRLVPLGEHDLRGIATPCAVFTLPED
jgi:hypothetical protein